MSQLNAEYIQRRMQQICIMDCPGEEEICLSKRTAAWRLHLTRKPCLSACYIKEISVLVQLLSVQL